ncbi:MAG: glycerol-3-phosphate dehydrogenase/oxidase [Nitrospirae bacterium]|nr:glycerol-3-phosphate dehydrogenase/oxidase [Nitrospirota bacterium]
MPRTDVLDADRQFDVIVIGGGITGAGAARDAALRGLSCLLLEKGDFASGVTSKSTRLIHGGLRYLANFEMDLVAESLIERAILRKQAPYLIHPMPILIPIYKEDPHGRAVMSIGIHLYDLLSHEKDIPHYFTSNRGKTLGFEPRLNREGLIGSALFYDHQITMPERLVIENIISAREAGARLLNYVRAERIEEVNGGVVVTAKDTLTGMASTFRSKVLINAAGPWIDRVRHSGNLDQKKIIFPTKGIHLVLPKLSNQALFVTSRDGRMFFIIPLEAYSLIGTTDTKYNGDLDEVYADQDDVEYLLTESRRILPKMNLTKESILYSYAGIRPLAFSGRSESKISRKHRVIREGRNNRIITIAGGKLTTYRNMAKDVVDAACRVLGTSTRCSTDKKPLPGGLPVDYEQYLREAIPEMASRFKVAPELVRHLISCYGARTERVLELAASHPVLGGSISSESSDIYAQVLYSVIEEGARTLSDIVLRRMHLGITASRGLRQAEKIADIAGRELKWSDDEIHHQIDEFKKALQRETACLSGPARKGNVC